MSIPDPTRVDLIAHQFVPAMQKRFEQNVAGKTALFTTDAIGLFAAFLGALPEHEQQHHTCNACRHFIDRFGKLVTIDVHGNAVSAIWNEDDAPDLYKPSVKAMLKIINKARVNGVFYSPDRIWGTPNAGGWTHLAIKPTAQFIHNDRGVLSAHQAHTARQQDHGTLCRALADFTEDQLKAAVNMLQSDALHRSDRFLGPAQWLLKLKQAPLGDNRHHNIIWLAVATAPAGWCKPRSGAIGTLLDDIADGLDFNRIKSRFATITASENYQRATTAPSEGTIKQAEKMFNEFGLAPALDRRYAALNDIPADVLLWTPAPAKNANTSSSSLFSHLRQAPVASASDVVPTAQAITFDKFIRTVLPSARNIEVRVPNDAGRFAALVTAANESAPPILQWDSEERRNPFSWYYSGGIDAEMRRRLVKAGGQFENVDIRCTLAWDNYNDLDIHAVNHAGEHVYYGTKRDSYGGWLDVDMNAGGHRSDQPVENIRWPRGTARPGNYRFYVNFYNSSMPRHGVSENPFRVEIEINGQIFSMTGVVNRYKTTCEVATFNYQPGTPVRINAAQVQAASTSPNEWGVAPNTYVNVRAIVPSPNLWNNGPAHHGQHAFFILDGCQDRQEGVGRGFITEMTRSDLHPVRSVIEAYNSQATIMPVENPACGIGISKDGTGDLIVRVTSDMGKVEYKIDRWD